MTPAGFSIGKPATKGRQEAAYQLGGDKLDKAPAPNGINVTFPLTEPDGDTEYGKVTFKGIFAFEKDRLKLCFRFPKSDNMNRPTDIPDVPAKDSDLWVIVLEREEIITPVALDSAYFIDMAKLQGVWKLVGQEEDGKKSEIPGSDFVSLTFNGEKVIMSEGGFVTVPYLFKLDTTKKPRELTFIVKKRGNERKETYTYLLDGDHLKLYSSTKPGAASPGDFESKEGTSLQIYKREKNPEGPDLGR